MTDIDVLLEKVCRGFRIEGEYLGHEHIKTGNVNQTYKINFITPAGIPKSYIVQAVNTYAFRQPEVVMRNIDLVTERIHQNKPGQIVLHYHHTPQRKTYISDETGFWRLSNYITSISFDRCEDLSVIRKTGEAFGDFQMQLADFDANQLAETIPHFHDTPQRIATLLADAAQDPKGRRAQVAQELAFIESVRDEACQLTYMLQAGQLPIRVTHNDTKINNVLFDPDTRAPIAVIDLDTVMPGLVAHDFGDAVRFAANFVAEDFPEWEKAGCNLEIFRAFAQGFLSKTAATLTQNELDTLAVSPFVLAVELASRFLDDYLLGDPYFKINYPEHNLVRTRCQLALARDFWRKIPEMRQIIQECADNSLPANS